MYRNISRFLKINLMIGSFLVAHSPVAQAAGDFLYQSPVNISSTQALKQAPVISFNVENQGKNETMRFAREERLAGRPIRGKPVSKNGQNNQLLIAFNNSTHYAFDFAYLHFHQTAEHRVNGKLYPVAAHLVHNLQGFGLAFRSVIEVFIADPASDPSCETNEELDRVLNKLNVNGFFQSPTYNEYLDEQAPRVKGDSDAIDVNPYGLLPNNSTYYTYHGSLTTPPHTENVYWVVFETPICLNADISALMNEHTKSASGTNPLNGREVLRGKWPNAVQPVVAKEDASATFEKTDTAKPTDASAASVKTETAKTAETPAASVKTETAKTAETPAASVKTETTKPADAPAASVKTETAKPADAPAASVKTETTKTADAPAASVKTETEKPADAPAASVKTDASEKTETAKP